MKREIYYHPKVPAEIREIYRYYTDLSERLGEEFWTELMEALEYASEFPERHHFDPSGRRRSNLTKFPYHFLFRVFPDYIRVTIVRHDKRDPKLGSRRS